ncbi:MAG: hypothetical protein AAFV07_11445, partial [Bacteroidota bacterium]
MQGHHPDWAGFLMHEAHTGSQSVESRVFWCGTHRRIPSREALAVVAVHQSCDLQLELWSPKGTCIWRKPIQALPEMAQTFAWPVEDLPKGLYLLRLESPAKTLVAKWLHS